MIITCRLFGQMCNQIQTLAAQIASHREHKIKFGIFYTRFEHISDFRNLGDVDGLIICNSRHVSKLVIWTLRALSLVINNSQPFKIYSDMMDDTGRREKRILERRGFDWLNLFEKFPYYDYESICRHYDYVKQCFEFSPDVSIGVKNKIAEYKLRYDAIIGVHVRRGDYKQWLGGKFYFNDNVYTAACVRAACVLGLNFSRTLFIICSNEEIERRNYALAHCEKSFGRNAIEDLCILSNCDYIISTQSTFSGWASYYGRVPAFRIRPESLAPVSRDDFLIHFFETDGAGYRRSKITSP